MIQLQIKWTLTIMLGLYVGVTISANKRERQCCGYSVDNSQSSICQQSNECIVLSPTDSQLGGQPLLYQRLPIEECQISRDSKLESRNSSVEDMKLKCLQDNYIGEDIRQAQVMYGIIYGYNEGLVEEVEYESHLNTEIDNTVPLPFSIHPYILTDPKAEELPAIEVRVAYGGDDRKQPSHSPWSQLRFRIQNRNNCDVATPNILDKPTSSLDSCLPRCVSVDQKYSVSTTKDTSNAQKHDGNIGSIFTYDCEVGTWIESHMTHTTSGNTYQIDLCLTMDEKEGEKQLCGTYLFRMPFLNDIDPTNEWGDLVLLEKAPLFDHQSIVVYYPPKYQGPRNIALIKSELIDKEKGQQKRYLIKQYSSTENTSRASFDVAGHIEPGFQYEIILTDVVEVLSEETEWVYDARSSVVASFSIDINEPVKRGATIAVILLLLLASTALIAVLSYIQYLRVKRNHKVDPKRLLESGRINAKKVLVITNLDNRHHIDIILAFNKYLKTHCGVGETIFAPDTETGIASQPDQDPWKWAQDTADTIEKEDGHLVFIGGPPTGMGITIYKDFPNNQAFISTKILKDMADKGRISIVMFPYSDPSTIPTALPTHLKGDTLMIPGRGMNHFLCQLLEVKKRVLCACLPFPIIRPEVSPQDFVQYHGGKELLQRIDELSEKVDTYKKQCAEEAQHGDEVAPLNNEANHHHISIIKPERLKASVIKNAQNVKKKIPSVHVDIESKTISLRSKDIKNRDPDDLENC